MRDRLIKLLDDLGVDDDWYDNQDIADQLIENGVIVPPCKVGDTVYMLFVGEITPFLIYQSRREENVDFITSCYDSRGYDTRGKPVLTTFCDYHIGKTVFLTKEEAERALKEREKV